MAYAPLASASFLLHALCMVLTVAVSVAVAHWVVRQADDAAARTMVALLLAHAVIATLALLQLFVYSPTIQTALQLTWYGLVLATFVLWFLFCVQYTGREHWLTARVRVVLGASILVPFALVVTNPYHRLVVAEWTLRTEPFRFQQAVFGDLNLPLFAFVSLYTLAGFALLFRLSLFSRRSSRWQSAALLGGMIALQGSALLSVTEYVPIRNFPYGVYGSGLFGIVVALSLFRSPLFAVAPLARDALFESLEDGIVVLDPDRRLVDYNDRAADIFPAIDGRIGQPIDEYAPELVGSSDRSADPDDRVGDAENGGTEPIDLPHETDVDEDSPFAAGVDRVVDGDVRSYKVGASSIDRGGKARGYVLVVSDVTEMVTYSKELERKTERLEQFASVLSHDLRNPVSVAQGWIELEQEEQEEQEEQDSENLDTALHAIHRIEETIDDLLTLARSGETITHPETVALRTAIEDAWETSSTGDATLSLEIDAADRIRADPSRLATLLENLFRNAADHGGEHVTVGPIEPASGRSGLFVADDGPGIPADEREQVFEYGYSTAEEGTGFGLAIVRSVADAHDWSIAVVESEAGGARFEVTGVDRVGTEEHVAGATSSEPIRSGE